MPVGSPASTRPPNTSALTLRPLHCWPLSPRPYAFWTRFLLVFRCLFVFWWLCSVPGPFSLAVPQGSALHRFVWRLAAGCHIVPRVLIRCQLLSIFTSPPCLTLSACVTACLHPPSAERKYKNNTTRCNKAMLFVFCLARLGWRCWACWKAGWSVCWRGTEVERVGTSAEWPGFEGRDRKARADLLQEQ